MRLTSQTARIPKLVHFATIPLSISSSDKKNLSEASTSTAAPQTPQTKEGFHQSFKQEFDNPMTLPDLWIANLNTVEERVNPQETINSIDMGFTLIDEMNMQRSPSIEEVKLICDIYSGVSDVLHFPPYLRIVCDILSEQIPRILVGIPCRFTTKSNEIPL